MHDRRFWLASFSLFAAARIADVAAKAPEIAPDTAGYRQISFVGNAYRPWGYSAVLRALPATWVVIVQVALSIAALCLLAYALADTLQDRRLKRTCGVVVLTIGVSPRVTSWDIALLTESLTLSLSCVLLASALLARRDPRWWALFVPTFGWWLFMRDGHAYLGLFVVAALAVLVRPRRVWLTASTAALWVWSMAAGFVDQRVELTNVRLNVLWRGVEDDRAWFVERGLPEVSAFDEPVGLLRHQEGKNDPALVAWVDEEGTALWVKYLIDHPVRVLDALRDWSTLERIVTFPSRGWFDVPAVWPDGRWFALLGLLALLSVLVACRDGWNKRLTAPLVLVAFAVPQQLLAYHASPIELARHGLLTSFTLVIALWWVIATSVDVALDRQAYVSSDERLEGCEVTADR